MCVVFLMWALLLLLFMLVLLLQGQYLNCRWIYNVGTEHKGQSILPTSERSRRPIHYSKIGVSIAILENI